MWAERMEYVRAHADKPIVVILDSQAVDVNEIFLIPVISGQCHDLISASAFGALGGGRRVFVRLVNRLKPCSK